VRNDLLLEAAAEQLWRPGMLQICYLTVKGLLHDGLVRGSAVGGQLTQLAPIALKWPA
jgi:hypothetical protein